MVSLSRYLRNALVVACLFLGVVLTTNATPIAGTSLSIGNYTVTSVQRISRFEYDYTYTAQATNSGSDLFNVAATLTSSSAAMTIVDGNLDFGDIAASITQSSSDTFTVRHNRRMGSFDTSAFAWDVTFNAGGTPTSASLTLSNTVIPTSAAGGSVDAQCTVLDQNGSVISPQPAVTLSTDSTTAVLNGTAFSFPDAGEFQITCAANNMAITTAAAVVVLDDAIDALYSTFSNDLNTLGNLLDTVVTADAADDLAGLQAAKDALTAKIPTIDLAGLAGSPPVLSDAEKPTAGELLAAGDNPDPVVDNPFKSTVQLIEQNLINVNTIISGVTPGSITQADVDAVNNLTSELNTLTASLTSSQFPSHTAILDVNNELNNIVSNLLPGQATQLAQFIADSIATVPGITFLDWRLNPGIPQNLLAVLQPDLMAPGGFYASVEPASLLPLPSVPLIWRVRWNVFENLYFPLLQYITRNTIFLRKQNLLPSSATAPVITDVLGPSIGNLVPGNNIQIFGSGFSGTLSENTIEVTTPVGVFNIPVLSYDPSGVLGELLVGGPIPNNMCVCPFGIPESGVVRAINTAGTSNGITVTVFP